MRTFITISILAAMWVSHAQAEEKPSEIEQYVQEASEVQSTIKPTAGSIYSSAGLLADLGRDLRANQINDIVTIFVLDQASAVSRGVTATSRKSNTSASIASIAGPVNPGAALANLASMGGSQQLQGQGETSRETVLSTTISARVVDVLPNGYLVLEGSKNVHINSENQQVTVRGVARWSDLGPANTVSSDRLAYLEVKVNGKGVVGNAVRRPNFLYRLLLGILPF